jgi:hypothetical protein
MGAASISAESNWTESIWGRIEASVYAGIATVSVA